MRLKLFASAFASLLPVLTLAGQQPLIPGQSSGSLPFSLGAPTTASPLTQPTLSPGVFLLFDLEHRFAESVAKGGGKAFATWFADDAVTLSNGQPAVLGRGNIAAQTNWDPKVYQLTWTPQGAQMLPSNDAGYTWGHYEGRTKDRNGEPIVTTGRYITLWKKTADGSWKVALDASAQEPPNAGECCSLPKP